MKAITIKLPEELDQQLTAVAEKTGESKSNLIRSAIEYLLSSRDKIAPNSCLDLAKDLSGSIDGPADLSSSKKHLKGYGQ
jgi:Arc/MetJ-type ribon-helix-helix transcriptional regulator